MEVISIQTTQTSAFKLSADFLAPYYRQGDPFKTLLARSTYASKYCRNNETWTDTIRRVVEGSAELAYVHRVEAERLFHLFWTGQMLPPGRGLWVGGVPGIPADSRYNCWSTTLRGVDDWCWMMNQLMLGGGVGLSLGSLADLPVVANRDAKVAVWCRPDHTDIDEVQPNVKSFLNGQTPVFRVPDSREGWVDALRIVLTAAFEGKDYIIDVSDVRQRGLPIRTFGGVACGPGPLAYLLRSVWEIVSKARGRKLTSVEALDVTNLIGFCVKSGNVRRSALIVLGDVDDMEFRDAKKDWEAVKSHRHTSNNSLAFRTQEQIDRFDWARLVEDNIEFGEPGLLNLPLIWKTDPGVTGVNPCFSGDTLIAVADGRHAVPIRQLAEEGKDVPVYSMDKSTGLIEIKMGRHPRITGYQKKLVRVHLDDGSYLDTTPNHKFILRHGGTVEAKDLKHGDSLPRFKKSLEPVVQGGKDYYLVHRDTRGSGVKRTFEHRMVAKFHSPEEWAALYDRCARSGFTETGGLVVHHKDYNPLNNTPENLQIMTFRAHAEFHAQHDTAGERNWHYSGVTKEEIKEKALDLTRQLGRRFSTKDWREFAGEQGLPQSFSMFRQAQFGSVLQLAQACAEELGFEHPHVDPRVVRTFNAMLEQGYETRIHEGQVLVTKTCEGCSSDFEVSHSQREHAFCSEPCSNAYINSNAEIKERRVAGMDRVYSDRMQGVRVEQARVYSALKFDIGRAPNRKEWSLACKSEGLPSRIGPTLKFGFKSFSEVAEAGDNYNHKVVRVEELSGEHTVYNITVDDHHTVSVVTAVREKGGKPWYDGVSVRNCGEIPLYDREACNLAEIFPAFVQEDMTEALRLVTRYCLRQKLTPLTDPQSDAVNRANMRLGVGLGGICDFEWDGRRASEWYGVVRREANQYADELNVPRPIAVTTTKPSGTISLLNGSSPGIHAPYAPHYIRRARLAVNDPMSEVLRRAGVPHEPDVYDKTGKTLVFAFPMAAKHTRVTVQTETIRDQFERQAQVQECWADNSVSATLSFDPESERATLAACLKEYVPRLKSTSMLAKSHGYAQAPYEAIEESEYRERAAKIDMNMKFSEGGEFEIEECASGVCPIR